MTGCKLYVDDNAPIDIDDLSVSRGQKRVRKIPVIGAGVGGYAYAELPKDPDIAVLLILQPAMFGERNRVVCPDGTTYHLLMLNVSISNWVTTASGVITNEEKN